VGGVEDWWVGGRVKWVISVYYGMLTTATTITIAVILCMCEKVVIIKKY